MAGIEFSAAPTAAELSLPWQDSGAAVIRGFLDKGEASQLSAFVEAAYATVARAAADGALPDGDLRTNWSVWHGIAIGALVPFLRGNERDLLERWRLIAERIADKTRSAFGNGLRFCPERSFFRRHLDTTKHVPWHIDAEATKILGSQSFNVWLPLDAVGAQAPSIELIPGSHHIMREMPFTGREDYARSDDWVEAHFPSRQWCPSAAPGDAILFDQYVLHRTQRGCAAPRASCEFRFERTSLRNSLVWQLRALNRHRRRVLSALSP